MFDNHEGLMKFLTESKEELPTSYSSRVGPVENICNYERVGNVLASYLGAFLLVDWDAFLSWVFDQRRDYDYPFHDEENPNTIAPPDKIEVSSKDVNSTHNNILRTCAGALVRMTLKVRPTGGSSACSPRTPSPC